MTPPPPDPSCAPPPHHSPRLPPHHPCGRDTILSNPAVRRSAAVASLDEVESLLESRGADGIRDTRDGGGIVQAAAVAACGFRAGFEWEEGEGKGPS